jgi:hypothetical protein
MPFRTISPGELCCITRPHEPGEPARHVAELSDTAATGTPRQEETFVVLDGTLTMFVGEPPPESEHAEILEPAV